MWVMNAKNTPTHPTSTLSPALPPLPLPTFTDISILTRTQTLTGAPTHTSIRTHIHPHLHHQSHTHSLKMSIALRSILIYSCLLATTSFSNKDPVFSYQFQSIHNLEDKKD